MHSTLQSRATYAIYSAVVFCPDTVNHLPPLNSITFFVPALLPVGGITETKRKHFIAGDDVRPLSGLSPGTIFRNFIWCSAHISDYCAPSSECRNNLVPIIYGRQCSQTAPPYKFEVASFIPGP